MMHGIPDRDLLLFRPYCLSGLDLLRHLIQLIHTCQTLGITQLLLISYTHQIKIFHPIIKTTPSQTKTSILINKHMFNQIKILHPINKLIFDQIIQELLFITHHLCIIQTFLLYRVLLLSHFNLPLVVFTLLCNLK